MFPIFFYQQSLVHITVLIHHASWGLRTLKYETGERDIGVVWEGENIFVGQHFNRTQTPGGSIGRIEHVSKGNSFLKLEEANSQTEKKQQTRSTYDTRLPQGMQLMTSLGSSLLRLFSWLTVKMIETEGARAYLQWAVSRGV